MPRETSKLPGPFFARIWLGKAGAKAGLFD